MPRLAGGNPCHRGYFTRVSTGAGRSTAQTPLLGLLCLLKLPEVQSEVCTKSTLRDPAVGARAQFPLQEIRDFPKGHREEATRSSRRVLCRPKPLGLVGTGRNESRPRDRP